MKLKTEITDQDIVELKLKSGLEIHQQLQGKKLFCNCPTELRDDKPDFIVKRYLRASAGEQGSFDKAALAEIKKQKHFIYQGYNDTNCLIEIDEEPPKPVNQEALMAALQTSRLLNMNIVDQVRFMRKIVVNGSNTTGFQRTGLIAVNGTLTVPSGIQGSENSLIRIDSLCLEEDSCKDVEKNSNHTIYNLSRLGIPLVEIATAPDLKTPDMIRDAAAQLGMILRSLPNVKRGLGTIRQDVNISIEKGCRVEIKGAQDLKMIPTLARYEMMRQYNMIEIFEELKKRNASVEKIKNITQLLSNSESKVIKSALAKKDGVVLAVKLKGFAGITGLEVQPGRRYGSELSDHAKLMGVKGLFHSDELPNYGITQEEKELIYKELNSNPEKDAYLLIADNEVIAKRALESAILRAKDFNLNKEVRVARNDGTTAYMRPMPGASRMYPETDVRTEVIDQSKIVVPKLLSEKIKELKEKFGLAEDIVKKIIKDGIDFEKITSTYDKLKPSFIIDIFYGLPGALKKKYNLEINMALFAKTLLEKLNSNLITKDSLEEISVKLAKGEFVNYDNYKPISIDEIRDDVKQIVDLLKDAPRGAIIGKVMGKYKGKVDGKELSQLVNSLL
jgi:glutamyl-tRNA(Gln) amidotransferase subunit E